MSSSYFRAVIEYDGSDFLGFQYQASGRTVQGEIEQALFRLTQQRLRVTGSGRTDAGVHAAGQVIAFHAEWKHALADLHRGLNALLPPDIAVLSLAPAPADFHPRFSAIERWYRYQVGMWPGHSPLRARYAWELGPDLDILAMNTAADHLVGLHDFATFGQPTQRNPLSRGSTFRIVTEARWQPRPPFLFFDIRANGFLRHMVRTIVGALAEVGRKRLNPDAFADKLERCDRSLAAPPAPPQGLILMAVSYPADEETGASSAPIPA